MPPRNKVTQQTTEPRTGTGVRPGHRSDPAIVAAALARLRAGDRQEDVAREFGVCAMTLRRWAHKANRSPGQAPPVRAAARRPPRRPAPLPEADPAVEAPAEPQDGAESLDALSLVRGLVESTRAAHAAAQAEGDARAAQHAVRTLATMMPVLARLEKVASESSDVLRISRSEIAQARQAYRERVARLLEQPLTCAECGRRMRVAWVEGADPGPEVATGHEPARKVEP